MTKQEILKMAGVNSEDEFYQLYPNPESFFKKFQNGGNNKFSLRNNPYNAQYYNDKVERDFLLKKNGGDRVKAHVKKILTGDDVFYNQQVPYSRDFGNTQLHMFALGGQVEDPPREYHTPREYHREQYNRTLKQRQIYQDMLDGKIDIPWYQTKRDIKQLRDRQQYYLDNAFKEFKESENISVPTSPPSYDLNKKNKNIKTFFPDPTPESFYQDFQNGGDTEEDKIREIIENAFVKLPDINPSSRVRNANNVNRNNVERIIEDAAISANKLNQEYAQQRGVPTYANYYNPRYTGELREDPALSYVPPSVVPGENDAPLMEKPTQTGTDFSSVINKNNKKNTVRKKANNKTTGNPKPSDKTQTNSTDKIQPNPIEVENVLNRDRNNFLDYLYY